MIKRLLTNWLGVTPTTEPKAPTPDPEPTPPEPYTARVTCVLVFDVAIGSPASHLTVPTYDTLVVRRRVRRWLRNVPNLYGSSPIHVTVTTARLSPPTTADDPTVDLTVEPESAKVS